MQDYHKVAVWRRSHVLAIDVRKATQRMPRSGFGDLKAQLTSAAESIPMNIVEGCGAESRKEFARFLAISIKSANELEYQLELAHDHGVLLDVLFRCLRQETIEVRKMACGFRATVLQKAAAEAQAGKPAVQKRTTNPSWLAGSLGTRK